MKEIFVKGLGRCIVYKWNVDEADFYRDCYIWGELSLMEKVRQGLFEVIDSFAIRKKEEFYLIGNLKEGTVNQNWFLNVPLNKSLSFTVRIADIQDVEFTSDPNIYKLLVIKGDVETIDILLGMGISSELLDITIEGQD